jgi:hypothetical protein
MKVLITACSALVLSSLGGCGWRLGASSSEWVQRPTVGQQLIDLKKAHQAGALTETEYSKRRKELIDAALTSR